MTARLVWVGHATVLLELDGARLLTDPVLARQVLFLRRQTPPPVAAALRPPDAVLLSHLHFDHLHLPSLRRLGRDVHLVAPAGGARLLRRRGFRRLTAVVPGDELTVAGVPVTVVPADHDERRSPGGATATPVGYLIGRQPSVYFAGDTARFAGMADLAGRIDVALLPVWGWGPTLGPGHMTPLDAAQALPLLRPAVAIPVHWGTLFPLGLARARRSALVEPPRAFARLAATMAPEVDVRILRPGEAVVLGEVPTPPPAAGARHCPPDGAGAKLGACDASSSSSR